MVTAAPVTAWTAWQGESQEADYAAALTFQEGVDYTVTDDGQFLFTAEAVDAIIDARDFYADLLALKDKEISELRDEARNRDVALTACRSMVEFRDEQIRDMRAGKKWDTVKNLGVITAAGVVVATSCGRDR